MVPRLAAAAFGATFALLVPHAVVSQSNDDATLADFRACGALQRDSARLACFDGVLAADRDGGGIDEIAESAAVTEPAAPEVAVAATEPAATPLVRTEQPDAADAPAATAPQPEPAEATAANDAESEPTEVEAVALLPEQPSQTGVASAEEAPDSSDQSEEAREVPTANVAQPRPAEPLPATAAPAEPVLTQAAAAARSERVEASAFTIVEMTTRIPGAARFVTDDGRVFVQTSGGSNYRNFPDVPFPAAVEDGALGSTFLRLGPRLRVRVRTVE